MSSLGIKKSQIKKNIFYSISAQLISLLVAFFINLFVPKFISTTEYGLWQTFVLYSSYVGILHFGLLDGIMLRYSQYNYDELDKSKLSSQFQALLLLLSLLSIAGLTISAFINENVSKIILVLVSISILSKNFFTYVSYTFQLTNRINLYTRLIIVHRLLYLAILSLILLLGYKDFYLFCLAEIVAEFVSSLICSIWNKGLYFTRTSSVNCVLSELKLNISAGLTLLIANWASMFLMGSARMIIQWRWDIATFALFSFAISVTNLFLAFVNSISVVFFPSLKRMDPETLPKLYSKIHSGLSLFLFWCMALYYPINHILGLWLPSYLVSLKYLGIILPIIIYTSKVTLLTNNYLKAFRKENIILRINVLTLIVSIMSFIAFAFILNNVTMVIIAILISVMLRNLLSEIAVSRTISGIKFSYFDFFIETLMTITFILTTQYMQFHNGLMIYILLMIVYTIYVTKKNKYRMFNENISHITNL